MAYTEQEEQQVLDKIQIMISNINNKLHETKKMMSVGGNMKVTHKGVTVTLNEIINFSAMDIEGFIGYLFMTKQNEEVFGDFDHELVNMLFCSNKIVPTYQMNLMVKKILG